MPEVAEVEQVKVAGMMDRSHRSRNQQRIEAEEKELEELMQGKAPEPEQEEVEVETESKESEPQTAEEKSFKKRYGDLRRHFQQKEKEWEEKIAKLEKSAGSQIVPPASSESVEAWMNKYPEIAGIVRALAQKEAESRVSAMEADWKNFNEAKEENLRMQAENVIRNAHPDFDELKNSDAFHTWADEQPKWVQDALYENADDPKSVIRVIDLYKVDKGIDKKSKKMAEKDAASAVKSKARVSVEDDDSSKMWSESQVSRLNDRDYEKYEAEIMEAMRTGNFKYDLSGGAR